MEINEIIQFIYKGIDETPERLFQLVFALIGGLTAWFFRGKFDEKRSSEQHSFDLVSRSVDIAAEQYRKIIEMQANTIKELEKRVAILEARLNGN